VSDDLRGFGETARHAAGLAEAEARQLGLERVGTEHLLIGLILADADIGVVLRQAGGTVAAARHKVRETAGDARPSPDDPTGPLPFSSRASRAIGRAVRFSHADRSEVVQTRHVLLGVLDVEGTAGQVLRGIGVDVAALRTGLQGATTAAAAPARRAVTITPAAPRCSSCGATLVELAYHVVPARSPEGGSLDAIVFSCGACGATVAASRA
jgi:ATP-dependent Clp protease ATP-binding subunit ClpA